MPPKTAPVSRVAPRPRPDAPRTRGAAVRASKARMRDDQALASILDELEGRIDLLADRMLERYLASIPSYRSMSDETLRQVREVNRYNLAGFIRALRRGRGPSEPELAFIRESASRRAREGVPLSGLLQAYRLGAQLAWTEAQSIIGDGDATRLRAGIDLATAVMHWVDVVSGAVAQSYLEEYERLASDREAARRDFLDAAFSGSLADDEIIARAEALGLDPTVPNAVAIVALAGPTEDEGLLRTAQHRLRAMAVDLPDADRSLVVPRGSEIVVVFPASDDAPAQPVRAYVERAAEALGTGLRAGVGRPREALTELASCYREASIALAAAGAAGDVTVSVYGELLVEELILRERGVARRLAQTILEPLDGYPELKTTLVEYLRHGPSLPAVAKRLFLHPNTVSYRLARIRDLTGRDPKTPAGVAELFLALRAAQLIDSGH